MRAEHKIQMDAALRRNLVYSAEANVQVVNERAKYDQDPVVQAYAAQGPISLRTRNGHKKLQKAGFRTTFPDAVAQVPELDALVRGV